MLILRAKSFKELRMMLDDMEISSKKGFFKNLPNGGIELRLFNEGL